MAKRSRNWAIDQDYWDKLTPEEREWLRTFNGEYYRNSFPGGRSKIHPAHLKNDCSKRRYRMSMDALSRSESFDEDTFIDPSTEENG